MRTDGQTAKYDYINSGFSQLCKGAQQHKKTLNFSFGLTVTYSRSFAVSGGPCKLTPSNTPLPPQLGRPRGHIRR